VLVVAVSRCNHSQAKQHVTGEEKEDSGTSLRPETQQKVSRHREKQETNQVAKKLENRNCDKKNK
jgi:hypothetical protein